ncbi:O-acetyl-ADP-ribose deacetylase [bacterium]|nr:O-acetyl-ADP-ribose deacetylase [bacterium]
MTKIEILNGDITKLKVDAIVNAANKSLLGGGGVDGAIHRAAGHKLLEECQTLNGCETGQSKITKGYNLPAKFVIHTVGPVWYGGNKNEREMLKSCYHTALTLAKENGVKTIAFPAISCGVYRFPLEEACAIATETVKDFISNDDSFEKIIFIDINEEIINLYLDLSDINSRCQKLPKIKPQDFKWGGGFKNSKEGETPQFPYVIYTENVLEWVRCYYKLELIMPNYVEYVNNADFRNKKFKNYSRNDILNLLTYYIRQDRFCEGLLAGKIKSGEVTELVDRLHEITKG